jgi:hypothetical protein
MMRRLHPAAPQSGMEAADVEEVSPFSPRHRKQRYREITTQVFGLVLVLGAYSVAEYNIQSSADLVNSLLVFLPTFAWVFR